KLRLSGLSVIETAWRTGLSQPTVIRAFNAYRSGGWGAVPVGPRGRGAHKVKVNARVADADASVKTEVSDETAAEATGHAENKPVTRRSADSHLRRLEAESIHIMREVVAESENPVMLYSTGK